jgi:hypothetical protein
MGQHIYLNGLPALLPDLEYLHGAISLVVSSLSTHPSDHGWCQSYSPRHYVGPVRKIPVARSSSRNHGVIYNICHQLGRITGSG